MIRNDLDSHQRDLLAALVEADRRLPRAERESFWFSEATGNSHSINHPGFPNRERSALRSDLMALAEAGFIRVEATGVGTLRFDIRQAGYQFHAEMMENVEDAVAQIEETPHGHLDGEAFQRRFPAAYAKWSSARQMLYADDAHQHLTRIGHDCTEAIQAFASALVDIHKPPKPDSNPGDYIKRLDAVIDLFKAKVGAKRAALLRALVGYWVAASAVAERQEHGADKAGDPVTWEDARRVVFHTAIVMFEVDRTLQ